MFTGIIQNTGTVKNILDKDGHKTFAIQTLLPLDDKKIGDSIAINGACMTITTIDNDTFTFDCIQESLNLTNLNQLQTGNLVNLESTLKLNQGIDGHLVQGHVDQMGIVHNFQDNVLEIKFPEELSKYLAFKGSITVNGVSLTISQLKEKTFEVSLVPHTLKSTNLHQLKPGDQVNLEIDIIARYLDRLTQDKANQATYQFLKERNLL